MHLVGLTLHVGLQGAKPFVGEHEAGQVGRMGVRGLQDGLKLLSEAAQTQGATISAGPAIPKAFTHRHANLNEGRSSQPMLIQPQASSLHVLGAAASLDSGLSCISIPLPQRGLP